MAFGTALGTDWFIRAALALTFFLLGWLMWRKSEIKITRMTAKFFVYWGLFFAALNVVFGLQAYQMLPGPLTPVGIAVAHVFAYVSIAYLWRSITVFFYAQYERYWKVIAAWGGVVVLVAIASYMRLAPPLVFRVSIMGAFVLAGLALAFMGYSSARKVEGAEKQKLLLMTTGAWIGTIVASITNNLQIGPLAGMWANLVWMPFFVAAVWLDRVKKIAW